MAPQKPTGKSNGSNFGGVRGSRVQKQRKKHKVVLESAGNKDDDDKLRVVVRKVLEQSSCNSHVLAFISC